MKNSIILFAMIAIGLIATSCQKEKCYKCEEYIDVQTGWKKVDKGTYCVTESEIAQIKATLQSGTSNSVYCR